VKVKRESVIAPPCGGAGVRGEVDGGGRDRRYDRMTSVTGLIPRRLETFSYGPTRDIADVLAMRGPLCCLGDRLVTGAGEAAMSSKEALSSITLWVIERTARAGVHESALVVPLADPALPPD
jgi:hypothetical protein